MFAFEQHAIDELKECFEMYNIPKTVFTVKAFIIGFASDDALVNWRKAQHSIRQSQFNLTIMAEELLKGIQ